MAKPSADVVVALYQVLASRRAAYDGLMWQVPALGLSAQAFLLTIALGADTARAPRGIAGALALVIALISMQLMAKHRFHESLDARELDKFEQECGVELIATMGLHRRPAERAAALGVTMNWVQRRRSYTMWMVALGIFAAVAATVVGLAAINVPVF